MAIHTFTGVSSERLENGLNDLRDSGFTIAGNRVTGLGVEATFNLEGDVLTVNVEKSPSYLGSMIENQLRSFFG